MVCEIREDIILRTNLKPEKIFIQLTIIHATVYIQHTTNNLHRIRHRFCELMKSLRKNIVLNYNLQGLRTCSGMWGALNAASIILTTFSGITPSYKIVGQHSNITRTR